MPADDTITEIEDYRRELAEEAETLNEVEQD
jgi:hypothetical protein